MAEKTNLATSPTLNNDDRSAEEIRQDIAARRESISETVDRLSDRFQKTLDWRTYVSEHPMVAVGVAVGAGFLLSGLFKPRPSPRDRILDAVAESIEDVTDRFRHQVDGLNIKRSSGLGTTAKSALLGLLTKVAIDYGKRQMGMGPEQPMPEQYGQQNITAHRQGVH